MASPDRSFQANRSAGKPAVKCFNCQGLGHYSKECPSKHRASKVEKPKECQVSPEVKEQATLNSGNA